MKMKTVSWPRVLLPLTIAIPLSFAQAQLLDFTPPPTNAMPTVRLVAPHEGAMILAGENIHVCAQALYFTDTVAQVEFFAGTNSLGVVTNSPIIWGHSSEFFCLTWSNATQGAYTLTAVATDAAGTSVASAGVDISVVTNLPPRVHITRPANGATLRGPTNITICAAAFDRDGSVASVEFFEGTTSLGVVPTPPIVYVTNSYGVFPIRPPYCVTWSNAPLGTFTLTAVATDNTGLTAISQPVTITIVSNLPPRVHIASPYNGSTFQSPADIRVCATASDPDGSVSSVEFFAGATSLGVVTSPLLVTNFWQVHSLYCLMWSNATAGTYALTAVATDNDGLASTSAPVNIRVLPPPQPTVRITNPRDGATIYGAPTRIYVCATERYFTNPIVNVQFFAGTNSVGVATNSPYSCIVWRNVGPGAYSLTAVATESTGATVTSAPVNITVTTNPPPVFWGR